MDVADGYFAWSRCLLDSRQLLERMLFTNGEHIYNIAKIPILSTFMANGPDLNPYKPPQCYPGAFRKIHFIESVRKEKKQLESHDKLQLKKEEDFELKCC